MWHVSLEPRSVLSKAVWVKACWRLIQGKGTKAARGQTVRLSDMRGLSPRSPQEIQAMLSTLEPWHRRDLGMAFQQPTNRPLGQLSVKRSQSLMPKGHGWWQRVGSDWLLHMHLGPQSLEGLVEGGHLRSYINATGLCFGSVLRPGERHAHPYGGGRSSTAATGWFHEAGWLVVGGRELGKDGKLTRHKRNMSWISSWTLQPLKLIHILQDT